MALTWDPGGGGSYWTPDANSSVSANAFQGKTPQQIYAALINSMNQQAQGAPNSGDVSTMPEFRSLPPDVQQQVAQYGSNLHASQNDNGWGAFFGALSLAAPVALGAFGAAGAGSAATAAGDLGGIGGVAGSDAAAGLTGAGLTASGVGTGAGLLSGNQAGVAAGAAGTGAAGTGAAGAAGAAGTGAAGGLGTGGALGGVMSGLGGWGPLLASGLGALAAGSGSQQSGTTTVTNEPWAGLNPHLQDLYGQASALNNRAPFAYTPSPYTVQGQQMASGIATDPNSLTNRASSSLSNMLTPEFLNPQSNPAFAASVNDALGLAKSQFAGQYGGAAGGNLGNSGYQEGLGRTLGNVATNAYANQYNNNVNAQMQAAQLAPANAYANSNALFGIGQQQEAQQLNAYNAPWQNLSNYSAALQPGSQFGSTSTPYYTNPTASAIGGALGGYQLYNAFTQPNQQQPAQTQAMAYNPFGQTAPAYLNG